MTELPIIRSMGARAVVVPLARPLRTASGSIPASPLVLLDIETDQGTAGRAYLFGYTSVTLRPLCTLLDSIAPLLIGQPIAPVAVQDHLAATFKLLGRQGLLGMVLSGIDMALWDALGRLAGRAVAELLGGRCEPITAYDSFGLVDPRADRRALEASVQAGFKAIKIKIGAASPAEDVETVRAVRDIIGPEVQLMVDLNQSQDVASAIRRIDRLAPYQLSWVEEPVAAEDLTGHARVRAATEVPIQTGEKLVVHDGHGARDRSGSLRSGHAGPDEDRRHHRLAQGHGPGRNGRPANLQPHLSGGKRPCCAGKPDRAFPGIPRHRRTDPDRAAEPAEWAGNGPRPRPRHGLG